MTAVERLDQIEARVREDWPMSEEVWTLLAALRAVLALCDAAMETDGYAREWGDVPQHRIRDAITAALEVTP